MAKAKYIARKRVNIDGAITEAGNEVKDVPEARCEELRGRFLDTAEDLAEQKKAADVAKKAAAGTK